VVETQKEPLNCGRFQVASSPTESFADLVAGLRLAAAASARGDRLRESELNPPAPATGTAKEVHFSELVLLDHRLQMTITAPRTLGERMAEEMLGFAVRSILGHRFRARRGHRRLVSLLGGGSGSA
jgi:hypothetical protein